MNKINVDSRIGSKKNFEFIFIIKSREHLVMLTLQYRQFFDFMLVNLPNQLSNLFFYRLGLTLQVLVSLLFSFFFQ